MLTKSNCQDIFPILGIQDQGGVKTRNIHNKKLDSYSNFYILGFFLKRIWKGQLLNIHPILIKWFK